MALHTDPVTYEVVRLFGHIVDRYNKEYDSAAAHHELTQTQAKAIVFLEEAKSMGELATCLRSEPPNVTGIIDRLVTRDLVERTTDSEDRRVKLIVVTEQGRQVAKALKDSLDFAAEPLSALNEAERRDLRDLLRKMRNAAEATLHADTQARSASAV